MALWPQVEECFPSEAAVVIFYLPAFKHLVIDKDVPKAFDVFAVSSERKKEV